VTEDHSWNEEGGESACFAHLICPECAIVLDGTEHAPGCALGDAKVGLDLLHNFEPDSGE